MNLIRRQPDAWAWQEIKRVPAGCAAGAGGIQTALITAAWSSFVTPEELSSRSLSLHTFHCWLPPHANTQKAKLVCASSLEAGIPRIRLLGSCELSSVLSCFFLFWRCLNFEFVVEIFRHFDAKKLNVRLAKCLKSFEWQRLLCFKSSILDLSFRQHLQHYFQETWADIFLEIVWRDFPQCCSPAGETTESDKCW